jgi:alkanesulfonate monooxygenase SsuD/methylene tetrahydromethanopterin reductase-like flavin-dependent oxidoreductase (luciferase family)
MADSENVDSVWVPESWGRESFSTLGAVAQVTEKVRLGTSIISIFARTPATVAMGAMTLDMLSNNRAVIGLGSSTEAIVEGWHGARFEQPVARMREYVECLRLMTSGEKASYAGKFYNLKNFKLLHQPPRSHVPIFVAAVNKRMVSLASELADGVLLYMRPFKELGRTITGIKKATSGRKFEVALSLICAISDSEPGKAREKAAKTLAFYVAVGKYYARFLADNGFPDEVARISDAYWKSGGDAAAKQVTEKMLDSITIAGTRGDCRKALARFCDAGVTLPILQLNPVEGAESSFREMLSTF